MTPLHSVANTTREELKLINLIEGYLLKKRNALLLKKRSKQDNLPFNQSPNLATLVAVEL